MSADFLLILIVSITALGYAFEQILDYINLKSQKNDIPDDIAAFYDRARYVKSLEYHRELTRFSFLTSAFGFLLTLAMLLFGGFGALDNYLATFITNEILRALAFFGILMLASDLLTVPFQLYSTFVIEEKYGFN